MCRSIAGHAWYRATATRLVLTDCDGVLTDGGVFYGPDGEVLKRFNIRDGMGVERLRSIGVECGIVTGERSPSVLRRAEKLGIAECHLGIKDKLSLVQRLSERLDLPPESIAYIGDDVNDLPVFHWVGLTACPGDALPEVRGRADVVCELKGGQGAFREFAEFIISAQRRL